MNSEVLSNFCNRVDTWQHRQDWWPGKREGRAVTEKEVRRKTGNAARLLPLRMHNLGNSQQCSAGKRDTWLSFVRHSSLVRSTPKNCYLLLHELKRSSPCCWFRELSSSHGLCRMACVKYCILYWGIQPYLLPAHFFKHTFNKHTNHTVQIVNEEFCMQQLAL